jgi:H(+)-translocating pyrophosphatase
LDFSKVKTIIISDTIAKGADDFLRSEYKALSVFVLLVSIFLGAVVSYQCMICFIVGAFLSALTGYIGMHIATKANIRTTLACQGPTGLNDGLQVAFKSGAVMALGVVSCSLLGVSILYLIFDSVESDKRNIWDYLSGFAFGGSSIALFARVGGGIYTKAADVGADLVGKVEEELEEDSPENPATIADNVGDNVGDVAGMGADLFESYVGSLIAACTLGYPRYGNAGIALPFWVLGFGSISSIVGILMIRNKSNAVGMEASDLLGSLLNSIRTSIYGASFLVLGSIIIAIGATFGLDNTRALYLALCIVDGLVAGILIGYFTEYATSYTYTPTQSIARKGETGAAPVIIQGLGVGMLSTVPSVMFVVIATLAAYAMEGIYGIAISAIGMLSTLGVTLATDAFGPVADNAGGIAEMAPESEIADDVRDTTDALDALGNTTAATGKGFAIGSAVLTALALMSAFAEATGLDKYGADVLDKVVLPGVLLGALMPFVFSALTMLSVGKAAESVMWECRHQLNQRHFDNVDLDSQKCVRICAYASLKEMAPPGAIAITAPIIVGTLLGPRALLGMILGAISSGFLLGVMMSNAGGAWDNAKKWVEKGKLGPGKGKKSDPHKATVVGDTVGDPFKDTSGPSLNILIKLMSIVSLVVAPVLSTKGDADDPQQPVPRDDWELWWVALIISGILLILGWAYMWLMQKYGTIHNIEYISAESAKRKADLKGASGDKKDGESHLKPKEHSTAMTPLIGSSADYGSRG